MACRSDASERHGSDLATVLDVGSVAGGDPGSACRAMRRHLRCLCRFDDRDAPRVAGGHVAFRHATNPTENRSQACTRGATTIALTNFSRSPVMEVAHMTLVTAARPMRFPTGARLPDRRTRGDRLPVQRRHADLARPVRRCAPTDPSSGARPLEPAELAAHRGAHTAVDEAV